MMILGSVGVGLAALAKRLVELAPHLVLSGAKAHRLDRPRRDGRGRDPRV